MIILASASPRRKEILSLITDNFAVIPAESECEINKSLLPEEAIIEVAKSKASEVFSVHTGDTVIGSDTVVMLEGEYLGKPKNAEQAKQMLRLLSGKTHKVITAVSILAPNNDIAFASIALVEFCALTDSEIDEYVASGEPMDKAGAYGIQGKGAKFVKKIDGDFYTVMGLPCAQLYASLKSIGV